MTGNEYADKMTADFLEHVKEELGEDKAEEVEIKMLEFWATADYEDQAREKLEAIEYYADKTDVNFKVEKIENIINKKASFQPEFSNKDRTVKEKIAKAIEKISNKNDKSGSREIF